MPRDDTAQLQALLDLAGQGDSHAYDQLIGQAAERLLKLTRKMLHAYPQLRRWENSGDVTQTAVIRLQRSLHNVEPDSVRAFFGLATLEIRRSLIDLIRHHFDPEGIAANHHSDAQEIPNGEGQLAHSVPTSGTKPETIEAWERFHSAIEELPAEESEVFHLVWYAGLPQRDIAEILGISIPTVKRRLRSARLNLFHALDGESPLSRE